MLVGHPVYAVADGMGGHDAGDRASQAVVAELRVLVGRTGLVPEDLSAVIDSAHSSVRAIADLTERGAGSTVTGAVFVEHSGRPHWLIFNIGDSRVYRHRDGELTQLTVDHSMAQALVEQGKLAKEDMSTYTGRNVITKAVGADDSSADYWLYPIVSGETLVICSDGLTGEVADDVIAAELVQSTGAQLAADRLVALALANGGKDNVTVIVLDVVAGGVHSDLDESTAVIGAVAPVTDELDETTIEVPRSR